MPDPVGARQGQRGRAGGPVAAQQRRGPLEELGPAGARQAAPVGVQGAEVLGHPPVHGGAPALQLGAGGEVAEDPVVLVEDVQVAAAGGGQDRAGAPLAVVHADPVQDGDGLGGQQRGVGPGGVLVEAGRELQALALHVLAAVRLVPHDHQHAEQGRAVGEPEAGRSLLGQPVREAVAHELPGPEGARVVVDEDVRGAGVLEPVGDGPEGAGGERVVAVEEEQVIAARPGQTRVAGRAQAEVVRQVHGGHPGVAGRVLVDDRTAGVRGGVVDRDQFQIRERLGQDRVQGLLEVRLNLVRGHDDAEPGHGTSRGRRGHITQQPPVWRSGYAACGIRVALCQRRTSTAGAGRPCAT